MKILPPTIALLVGALSAAAVGGGEPAGSDRNRGTSDMHPKLAAFIERRTAEFDEIPAERRESLDELAEYVRSRRDAGEPARLTFICTHNSRRSHLVQLWAAVAAERYGVAGVETFSGGTEATAFNPRAVAALRRAGFEIAADDPNAENPRYRVAFGKEAPPQVCFSKKYDAAPNPAEGYCAVLVCSEADDACPHVAGADARLALPYLDPKEADDTPAESARYDERTAQIAREMLYALSRADRSRASRTPAD